MTCKNCGANIADNAKFCGYCGNQIVDIPVSNEIPVQNIEQQTVQSEINIPIMEQSNVQSDVSNLNVNQNINNYETQQNTINIQNNNQKDNKNNKLIIMVVAIVLVAVALVLLLLAFNKSNSSIKVLEKAVSNLANASENNGTIVATLSLENESSGSINVSGTAKHSKVGDNYDFQLTLNKNLFFEEMNMYFSINKEKLSLYTQSNLIDMFGMTNSDTNKWLSYTLDLSEYDINLEEEEIDDYDIDFKKIIDKKHFVYIDTKDNLKHYQLIIDKELIKNLKKELDKIEDEDIKETMDSLNDEDIDFEETYKIDFYINKSNELVSISFDLTEIIDEEEITSAVISFEFKDLGTTNITIPNEALNAKDNLLEYLQIDNIYTDAINSAKERTVELVGNEIRLAHTSYLYYNAGEDTDNLCDYVNSKYIGNYYNIKTPCANNEVVLQNDGVDYKVVYNNGFITITNGTITKTIDLKN